MNAALLTDATTSRPPSSSDAAADLDSTGGATGDASKDAATTPGEGGDAGDVATMVTVIGKVVTLGQGIPGVTVVVGRQSAVTSASGVFTLTHVSVPYDLSAIVPAATAAQVARVSHFVGLHGTSPVVAVDALFASHTAQVTGAVTGGAPSPNATHSGFSIVATSASEIDTFAYAAPGTAASKSFDLQVIWSADQASTQAVLYALQTTPDTGIPTAYGFAGTSTDPMPVMDGATASNNVVPLVATTDGTVSGTIVVPAGYTPSGRQLSIQTANNGGFDFFDESASSTFSFATPSAPFITGLSAFFFATGPAGEHSTASVALRPGTTGNVVTLSVPPVLVSPAAGQTGVDGATSFSWTPIAGQNCLYDVRIYAGASMDLMTTNASVTIPDLSAFGAGLAPLTTHQWYVNCRLTAGAVTTDDAVTSSDLSSVGYVQTTARPFTTE